MKSAGPHFQIIGLMNHAALLGPEVMQREDEILESHEQFRRPDGGLHSRARRGEMSGKTNRNAQRLSRHNPSRIKELQHITSQLNYRRALNHSSHFLQTSY